MTRLLLLLLLLLVAVQGQEDEQHHCVWYGQCGTDELARVRNCWSNDTARVVNDDRARRSLKDKCPHLFETTGL